jgi:hypothetical protein
VDSLFACFFCSKFGNFLYENSYYCYYYYHYYHYNHHRRRHYHHRHNHHHHYTVFGRFSLPPGFAGNSHIEEQFFAKKSGIHIYNGSGICSLHDTSWTFVHNEMNFSAQGRAIIQAVNLLFLRSRPVSTPGLCMWDFVVDKAALGEACFFPSPPLLYNHPHLQ